MKTILLLLVSFYLLHEVVFSQSCLPEGIIFSTQAQIDSFPVNYPDCTEIEGDVIIGNPDGSDISNLNGLSVLTAIGGYMIVGGNHSLIGLTGLENLSTIGGSLQIYIVKNVPNGVSHVGNYTLTSLAGLSGLASIGGNLEIINNPLLSACESQWLCNYLSDPNGIINIYGNDTGCNSVVELANTCGDSLPCLPFGNYFLSTQFDIDNFSTSFPGCSSLQGDLIIFGLDNITDLYGLNVISSIVGDLTIFGCHSLSNFTGLQELTSIGGNLTIENNAVASLIALEDITNIGGYLTIIGNSAITSLSGLENIGAGSITNLLIWDNYNLNTCDVKSICDYLASPNGSINIQNNATGCSSQEEVEEDCANNCLPGGFTFTTQNLIDHFQANYPGCTDIQGDVTIHGENIQNLSGFSNVSQVHGNLTIYSNPLLTSLNGLLGLNYIGGDLSVGTYESGFELGNAALVNLSGLNNLTYIGSDLTIQGNTSLTSIAELGNVTLIGDLIKISSNPVLASLTGLDNIDTAYGVVIISGSDSLIDLSGLNGLKWAAQLDIVGNASLTSLEGLNDLKAIGWNLFIDFNPVLSNLDDLESLNSIGHNIFIDGNQILTSITGLENVTETSIGYLTIIFNDSLSECDVQFVCDYLASPTGFIDIRDNATGCNNPEEILAACGVGVEESSIVSRHSLVSIYPNPSSATITIELPEPTPEFQISIFNFSGQEIISQQINEPITVINIGNLSRGIYFVKLTGEDTDKALKLVKK